MGIAVDYAFQRPSIATLQANGVVAVGRYVGPISWGKCITTTEANSLRAAGIVYWLVFEQGTGDATSGVAGGKANAELALANLPSGVDPKTVVIYFAVDEAIAPTAAIPYFQGINSVLPYTQTGVYGEGALCTLLKTDGLAAFFWQSNSSSFPGNATTLPISHIQQKYGGSPIAGTDLDVLLQADFGQWPRLAPPVPTPVPPTPVPTPAPKGKTKMWIINDGTTQFLVGEGLTKVPIDSGADLGILGGPNTEIIGIPEPLSAGFVASIPTAGAPTTAPEPVEVVYTLTGSLTPAS